MALVSSVVPGMSWKDIAEDLPLAIGLQLRNIALAEGGVKIIPSNTSIDGIASDIFESPDDLLDFLGET